MDGNAKGCLLALGYDFRNFTMSDFIAWVETLKGRQILTIPWKMPLGMFGAWISDGDGPSEYIFYRQDVPRIHQVHIQLHELAHFLCGHPTLKITTSTLKDSLTSKGETLFLNPTLLRSHQKTEYEVEAETLASRIQERVIHYSRLDELTHNISTDQKMAQFIKTMGLI
jgi:hypothetical protein